MLPFVKTITLAFDLPFVKTITLANDYLECPMVKKLLIVFLLFGFLPTVSACESLDTSPADEATAPVVVEATNDPLPSPVPPTASPLPPATLPPPSPTAVSPPLTREQEIANLVAFGRLYGLIRYFHPSDQVTAVTDQDDWHTVLMDGIEAIQDAPDAASAASRLNTFWAPIAPAVQIYLAQESPPPLLHIPSELPPSTQIVMWEHYGVEADFDFDYGIYTSTRVMAPVEAGNIPAEFVDPAAVYLADLGGGLKAAVPLALYNDENGTYPMPVQSRLEDDPSRRAMSTRYLASAISYWTVIQHFYPYLDVIETDWDAMLGGTITDLLAAADSADMEMVLNHLLVQAYDGHGALRPFNQQFEHIPEIVTDWVEDQLVVIEDRRPSGELLPPGTVITAIDGQNTQEKYAALTARTIGASAYHSRYRAKSRLLIGSQFQEVELAVRYPDSTTAVVNLPRGATTAFPPLSTRLDEVAELSTGLFYVDLTRLNDRALEQSLPQLESARGIIFDLRGYPRLSTQFLTYLIDEPIMSPPFLVPTTRLPNQTEVEFDIGSWMLEPQSPRLTDNVVFLTNAGAISFAETLLAMVAHYDVGMIVGEPTAGTNGNINLLELPAGYTAVFTGMLVLTYENGQHHGVGVQPDLLVSPTIAGIAAGQDEQLDAALALIVEADNN